MVRFLISVTNDMHNILKRTANQRGQTLCGLIRQILWEWVDSRKQEERKEANHEERKATHKNN